MDSKVQKAVDDSRVTLWVSILGETVQILPNHLLDAGWASSGKSICCVHATEFDARNSAEQAYRSDPTGAAVDNIAYSIPFEDTTSSRTQVVHMTADVIIQGALVDPLLGRYSAVIVYQCHVRTIQMDMCLGLLKKILKKRVDLHVLICGAIPDYLAVLSTYFSDAAIVSPELPTYPVDIHYIATAVSDYVATTLETLLSIAYVSSSGNVIVFMPTKEGHELHRKLHERLEPARGPLEVDVVNTLHDLAQLEEAIYGPGGNSDRVIITSLSPEIIARRIPVSIVVDSGFQEVRYSRYGFLKTVKTTPISYGTAYLRTSIAGLIKPGKCYRVYPQTAILDASETPEIQRLPLDQCILQLKSLGVDNILRFDYPSPPPAESVAEAMDWLGSIGVIDDHAKLTKPLGEQLAQLPLPPLYSLLLLKALEQGCFEQIASLVAMWLSGGSFFDHDKSLPFIAQEGDSLTYINIYEGFAGLKQDRPSWCRRHGLSEYRLSKAVGIREQLLRILQHRHIKTTKSELATSNTIRRCIASVYNGHRAFQLPNGSYQTIKGSLLVKPHPSSVLYNRKGSWVVFEEAFERDGQMFIRNITTVEKDWVIPNQELATKTAS